MQTIGESEKVTDRMGMFGQIFCNCIFGYGLGYNGEEMANYNY